MAGRNDVRYVLTEAGEAQLTAPCPRCASLAAELADARKALAVEISYRTFGGTPLQPNEVEWRNRELGRPEDGATALEVPTQTPRPGTSPSTRSEENKEK